MAGGRRWLRRALGLGALLVATLIAILATLPRTEWAHERVRSLALDAARDRIDGSVEIGGIRGNLLSGASLSDVVVRDPRGRPVVSVARVRLRYALLPLLRDRLIVPELELVEPRVILERGPDGHWNAAALLREDGAAAEPADTTPGLGSWIRIDRFVVRDGHLTVRTPVPPKAPASDREAGAASDGRAGGMPPPRIERVGGHPRVVREVKGLDLAAADLILAHPDEPVSGRLVRLSATAVPFRAPALEIRRVAGRFRLGDDSLAAREVVVELPGSRLEGRGGMVRGTGRATGRIRVERLAAGDLAWLLPELPPDGEASLVLEGVRTPDSLRLTASEVDVRLEAARIVGRVGVVVADGVRPGSADLRFTDLRTGLIERLAPGADVPVDGTAEGRIRLEPASDGLRVEGDLSFRPRGGRPESRISVGGRAGLRGGDRVRDLRVELRPLRVGLVEAVAGSLPVGGRVDGRVTLDGAPGGPLAARLDLVHRDTTGLTRLLGRVSLGAPGPDRAIRADLRVPVLSLATAGRFAPAAGLRGSGRATLEVGGTLRRPLVEWTLAPAGGGTLAGRGAFDLEGAEPGYDVWARLEAFDARALSTRAPEGVLDGTLLLRGRGTDPATLEAELTAEIGEARVGAPAPVEGHFAVAAESGALRIERAELSAASARARIQGGFGLTAGSTGELHVRIEVDSLADFGRLFPPDTAAPDTLSGALRLEATLTGNRERIAARGRLDLLDVVARDLHARSGRVRFEGDELRRAHAVAGVEFALDTVRVGRLAFDSVAGRIEHRGSAEEGRGTARLAVGQDERRDYTLRAGYSVELDQREVHFEDVALRFDTARWASARPGTIRWARGGVAVDSLVLLSGEGGRIHVDGRFVLDEESTEAAPPADLVMAVEGLPLAHIVAIVQDSLEISGRLGLHVQARGPPSRARIEASLALDDLVYGETPLPALVAHGDYVPGSLSVEARVEEARTLAGAVPDTLLMAEGTVGVDLFAGEPRSPPALDLAVRADSMPLESLPLFTNAVTDVRGRLRGRVAVGGTLDDPVLEGRVDVGLGRMNVVWPGIELREIVGDLRFEGDRVRLDSLRARSGDGTLRAEGVADLAAGPRFDVTLRARNAEVLDNAVGTDVRIDGEVTTRGRPDSLEVTGTVEVREGILNVPESRGEVVDLDEPLARLALDSIEVEPEAAPDPSPVLAGLRMSVELEVARNTWVRADDATAEIYTPEGGAPLLVRYDGSARELLLDGIVHADRGEYSFAGRRFEITTGTATFLAAEEIDPLLSLTATHDVPRPGREALTIQIQVGGRLLEPTVTLTSDAEPPLSQTDLISYLVFGTSSTSLLQPGVSGLTGGDDTRLGALATQQLASLALGALVDEAFNSVESSTQGAGLDVFRIEPADLPDELAFEGYVENLLRGTRLEAGKYLGRRLFVAATGRPTTEAWPGFSLEYRSPGGFRLSGSWEPRYLPGLPSFDTGGASDQTRALALFLFWERREPSRAQAVPADTAVAEPVTGPRPLR